MGVEVQREVTFRGNIPSLHAKFSSHGNHSIIGMIQLTLVHCGDP